MKRFDTVRNFFYLVALIDEDDIRLEIFQLFVIFENTVADDDDLIADGCFTRGRSVEATHARTGRAFDEIGLETLAVIDIDDRNLLVRKQVGGGHQIGVKRQRTFIIKVGFRDGRPMDLRFKESPLHNAQLGIMGVIAEF